MPKHHIIYVTGLGDSHPESQRKAVSLWGRHGVEPHFFQMDWADGKPFAVKLEQLLQLIDDLAADDTVSLVGISAGGGAVINAFAKRKTKISGVVTVCGKFDYPKTVSPHLIAKNPAFGESMTMVTESRASLTPQDLQKVLAVYPLLDESVPPREAKLSGAQHKLVLSAGHVITIALMISLRAGGMIRFLKRQAK